MPFEAQVLRVMGSTLRASGSTVDLISYRLSASNRRLDRRPCRRLRGWSLRCHGLSLTRRRSRDIRRLLLERLATHGTFALAGVGLEPVAYTVHVEAMGTITDDCQSLFPVSRPHYYRDCLKVNAEGEDITY